MFDLNTRIETYGLNQERRWYYQQMIGLADVVMGSGIEEFGSLTGKEELKEAAAALAVDGRRVSRQGREETGPDF